MSNHILNLSASEFDGSDKSFGLLRTNPKITTNVKLVVDSVGDISLSAFDANRTLSDSRFKKFPVNSLGKYSDDISNFFKGVSLSEIFETKREFSDMSAYSKYSFQYEDTYISGAEISTSNTYSEQYRIFAPLWLNKIIPSKFVIYRVDSAISNGDTQNDIIINTLRDASIVKVFDLSKKTKIGNYINNHNSDENRVSSHLSVNFDSDSDITYNGIDIINGGFAKKADSIHSDYIKKDNTEISSNSMLTNGFERNGIVSSDLLNMEFMFDDNEAEEFKIYKYFGLYVDEIEEGSFSAANTNEHGISVDYGDVSSVYDLSGTDINHYEMLPNVFDISIPTLNYIKDINSKYYHVKNKSNIHYHSIPIGSADFNNFKGFKAIEGNVNIISSQEGFHGYIKMSINSTPSDGDRIVVGMKQDVMFTRNNTYDSITNKATYNFNEFTMVADSSIPIGEISGNKYSSLGTVNDISTAILQLLKSIVPSNIKTFRNNNEIVVEDYGLGYDRTNIMCAVWKLNNASFVNITGSVDSLSNYTNADTNAVISSDWDLYTLHGGAEKSNGISVAKTEVGGIAIGNYVKNKDGKFVKLISIVQDHITDNYRLVFEKTIDRESNSIRLYDIFRTSFGKFDAYDIKDFNFDFFDKDRSDIGELKNEIDSYGNVKVPSSFWNVTNRSLYPESSDVTITKTAKIPADSMDSDNNAWLSSGSVGSVWNSNGWIDSTVSTVSGSWIGIVVFWMQQQYTEGLQYTIKFDAKVSSGIVLDNNTQLKVRHSNSSGFIADHIQLSHEWQTFEFDFIADNTSSRIEIYRHHIPTTAYTYSINNVSLAEFTRSIVEIPLNVGSEYDRLSENKLKEHAVDSRISPDVLKFALKNGTDSRNKPYMLNVNPSFGVDNMSSDITKSDRNPIYHNLEYFNIATINTNAKTNKLTGFTSYVDECGDCLSSNGGTISIDMLKDTTTDYFSRYFLYDGYYADGVWVDDKRTNSFTKMEGGSVDNFSSSVFKGLRYVYKDRKEILNESPTEFIKNTKTNGYKKSTVLKYVSNSEIESNNTTIDVIKNEKFKFICTYITINVVSNDVSDITLSDMYTLDDITYGGMIVDSYLGDGLHFDVISAYGNYTIGEDIILKATDAAISSGLTNFTKKITKNKLGKYSYMVVYDSTTFSTYAVEVLNVIDDDTITVSGYPLNWDGTSVGVIPFGNIASASSDTLTYTYYNSGDYGFNEIFNTVTAGSFANRFNMFEDVKYTRIDVSGNMTKNDFVMSIESGTEFIKPVILDTDTDTEKPKSYSLHHGSIGNILKRRTDGGYFMAMRRMNGDYDPLFRDAINFTDVYNSWNILDDADVDRYKFIFDKFKGRGISFEYKGVYDIGFIPNYFFHKVNDENSENILKLSATSDKLPLYPVIGEIAIDKKDFNVFKSKYDVDYFTRSLPDGTQVSVHGTLSPIEKKSFMSSTIMKVKDSYDLSVFSTTKENTLDLLDTVGINENNETSIHWFEDEDRIFADFYVSDAILYKLKNDGLTDIFAKYVNPLYSYDDNTTILDDMKLYVESNIIPRFSMDELDIYMVESKSISTGFESVLYDNDIVGYTKVSNYSIQSINDGKLGFRFIFNKRIGYNYKFKTIIKIKA